MNLAEQYKSVRNRSVQICKPLKTEDYVVQPVVDVSQMCIRDSVHMVRLSEPYHQMGVDLGVVSRVKQSVNVNFADISGAQVPIRLGCKTVSRCLLYTSSNKSKL